MILKGVVAKEQAGLRLDDGAKALFPELSKTRIRQIVDWGGCAINQSMVRVASRILKEGDELIIGVMEAERFLEVAYRKDELLLEDADYLALNKAAGINSQRSPYQLKGTVEYAVGTYLKSLGISEPVMIVHRLDRGTSGVMYFPKNRRAAAHISKLLHDGEVDKRYWALVSGKPEDVSWSVDAPIAKVGKSRYGVASPGKEASTEFRGLATGLDATLLEARPLTGRTHQIRVHLEHTGLPIIGDQTYGGAKGARMMLHCRSMAFTAASGRRLEAIAPLDHAFVEECLRQGIDLTKLTE